MKGLKVKRFLALAVSFAMLVGNVGNTGIVRAAGVEDLSQTTKELVWESVEDDSFLLEEVVSSTEKQEVEEKEESYAEDDQVRVFIVFDGDSVVDAGYSTSEISDNKKAVDLSEKIEEQQEVVINDIENEVLGGETLDTRYSFTILTNAISAQIEYGKIAEIEEVEGVAGVYIVPVYETMDVADKNTITSGEMVGSYNTWQSGYTGAGMRIAVIDTGIDADHPSFTGDAFMYSLEETAKKQNKTVADYDLLDAAEVAQSIEILNAYKMYDGLTAQDTYLSEKIPYAFNYVDENLEVTHDNDTQGDHGTHVAGISTANKYVPAADGTFTTQEVGVVGIAPDAQLLVMKVFGAAGGAYTDDYMAAIEDALVLGADTINLSLGSASAGESYSSEEYVNEIFEKLFGTDSIVSISAGNSGYWAQSSQYGAALTTDVVADTAGSPGSYKNAFTVASAVNSGYTDVALTFDNECIVFYSDGSSADNAPFVSLDTTKKGTEYEYVLINGYGTPDDLADLDLEGKIVIVSRGEISFYEKHMNGENKGAAAVLVYNNQAGTIVMNLTGSTATIPCASITLSDAQSIIQTATYDEKLGVYTGVVEVSLEVKTNHNAADGYQMSSFSSWGVPGDLSLKPEITAPGGNIYSTLDGGKYGNMSGTSMASPSVCGMSALVLQYIQENDLAKKTGLSARTLGQTLLMSTAKPLVQPDGELYSPRKQGAGLANIESATKTPAYILVGNKEGNDGKVKVEFGDDPSRTGKYDFEFTVYNMERKPVYYKLDSTLLTESTLQTYYIANSSKKLDTKMDFDSKSFVLVYDLNGDKKVNLHDVNMLLKIVNHSATSDKFDVCYDDYDFNNDGIVNTCDVRLFAANVLRKDLRTVDIESKVLYVKDNATVKASINLSKNDKAYIDENFENGMYVEGFATLNGKIDLSIPVLGFYGNWTESSMFEPYDIMEDVIYGETWPTYTGIERTNYLTYKFPGEGKNYYYTSNMYETDTDYIPERNAISSVSGASIGNYVFTLIRNAANIKLAVTDTETNEEYFVSEIGTTMGAYYSSSQSKWMNTSLTAPINWKATDAEGNPLPDGTKVEVSVTALPSYYNDGKHIPAAGTKLSVPFVVDNTLPTAEPVDFADGKMTIKVQDNQYVSAVYVFDHDKETLINSYPVNQTEQGAKTDVTFEYPESVFYVAVIDYAGNTAVYRVNMSDVEDTEITDSITLSDDSIALLKGSSQRVKALVGPMTILDDSVVWTSDDDTIAIVNEDGIITAIGEGTTTITATTNAVDVNGEHLSASCEVTVFALDVDLNAIVWDEDGQVSFAKFNTSTLPEITDLSEKQNPRFWSNAVVGNKLIASTNSDSQSESDYYEIDLSDYSMEKKATSVWSTDMAYGTGSGFIYGTYAYLVNIYDPEEGDVIGQINLSAKTQNEYLVGIAHIASQYMAQYGTWCDWFYLVDRNGELYQMGYLYGLGYFFYDLGNTGINTNGLWYYNSIYYDAENDFIYWTCYDDGNDVTLYAISDVYDAEADADVLSVYELGRFADKVWPVSGLCQYSVETPEIDVTEGRDLSVLERVELSTDLEVVGGEIVKKEIIETEVVEEETTEVATEVATEEETIEVEEETTEVEAVVEEETTEVATEETTEEATEEVASEEETTEVATEEATIEIEE